MPNPPQDGWMPDPTGRHQLRYRDPATHAWTDHVSDQGVQGRDAFQPAERPESPTSTFAPRGATMPAYEPAGPGAGVPGQPPPKKTWSRALAIGVAVGALVVGLILGAAAGGSSSDKTKTTTVTVAAGGKASPPAAKTVTVTTPAKTDTKTVTRTVTKTVKAASSGSAGGGTSGGSGKTFTGNGGKTIAPFTTDGGTLKWTNDGDIFQVFDIDNAFTINSQSHSGETYMEAGTYTLDVNALGNWTITVP